MLFRTPPNPSVVHRRWLALGIAASVLVLYLRWGNGKMHGFVGQLLWQGLVSKPWQPKAWLHPLVLIPLLGWLLVLSNVFFYQKQLLIWGTLCCTPLVLMVLLAGLWSAQIGLAVSTLPFWFGFYLLLSKKRTPEPHQST